MKNILVAASIAWLAGAAVAVPSHVEAEKFLRDFDNLVGRSALQLETMPLRKAHQVKLDELEKRAGRLFGGPMDSPLGSCTQAAGYLPTIWTTQMLMVVRPGTPHDVNGLVTQAIAAGRARQACGEAVDELEAKPSKPKL